MAGVVSVRLEVVDLTILSTFEQLVGAEDDFVLLHPDEGGVPDLVILEYDEANPDECFARIHALQKAAVSAEIFLTAARADPDVLLKALRAGVREFFKQPIEAGEVKRALARMRELRADASEGKPKRQGKIVSVIGGKAGVGTTTVAVNLADCIQALDSDIVLAIVDLNLRGGDVPIFLDVNPMRGLQDIDSDLPRLDETFLSGMLSRHETGIQLLPLGEVDLLGGYITSDCIESTFPLLRTMFDYIVVDCGHVMDAATETAVSLSHTVIVVTSITIPAVRRTKRLLEQIEALEGDRSGRKLALIINNHSVADDAILDDAQHVIGRKPFWTLPLDHELACSAINEGKGIARLAPKKELAKSFQGLAQRIAEVEGAQHTSSIFGSMFRSLRGKRNKGVSNAKEKR